MWCFVNGELLSEKAQVPPEKIYSPFLLTPLLKIQKCKSPLFANIENFSTPPLEKRREDTEWHSWSYLIIQNITN